MGDRIDEADGVRIAPGKVLVRDLREDEAEDKTTSGIALPGKRIQQLHSDQKGNHFPVGVVVAIGSHLRGTAELNAMEDTLIDFVQPGDLVWYDYRGCGEIMWRGEKLYVVPRQYIIAKQLR